MKNILIKPLFISLLLSTVIPSAMQANQSQIKSGSDFLKMIIAAAAKRGKQGALIGVVTGVGLGGLLGMPMGIAIGIVDGAAIEGIKLAGRGVATGIGTGIIVGGVGGATIGIVEAITGKVLLITHDSSRNNGVNNNGSNNGVIREQCEK